MALTKPLLAMNWSGGKDSALALYYLLRQDLYRVETLLTSMNTKYDRVSMHGIRRTLLEKQVSSIGIHLDILAIPGEISADDYDQLMRWKMTALQQAGYHHAAFGDIYLEDLRQYREKKLRELGIEAVFPLWKKDSHAIVEEFIKLGFKAIVVCTSDKLLGPDFTGRMFDEKFLADLPASVDPCGENGEFHTFVFDGPIFRSPIPFQVGETILRHYESTKNDTWDNAFWYTDLMD